MASGQYKRIANDNAPGLGAYNRAYGAAMPLRTPPEPKPQQEPAASYISTPATPAPTATASLKLTLTLWMIAIVMMLGTFLLGAGTAPKILFAISLFWAGLWSSYVSADHGFKRLSELSIVTAIGGLMGAITVSANYFGIGLTFMDWSILMCVTPLCLGVILKSRICVLASICAGLIWAGLHFSAQAPLSTTMLILPLICAVQIGIGTRIRSKLAVTLSVVAGYIWAGGTMAALWAAGLLPATFAAAFVFVMGAAHHRLGKAAEDTGLTGSNIHVYAGWIASILGAIGFQYFWLDPDAIPASTATLSTSGLILWKIGIAIALAAIFVSGIIRYKYSQMTLAGIFLLTVAAALIPAMLWLPQWPRYVMSLLPGMTAAPTAGIFMGAAIFVAAMGMGLNGLRRGSFTMISLSLAAIAAQAHLLLKPEFFSIDNAIIFCTGLLLALSVGAAIAGSSLSHLAPAPRFKTA